MKPKIIRPEGQELLNYLNEGYAICNKCGAVMDLSADGKDYVCDACGWTIDSTDYVYDGLNPEELTPEMLKAFGKDIPPAGCIACGGPYPHCKMSCKLFDD